MGPERIVSWIKPKEQEHYTIYLCINKDILFFNYKAKMVTDMTHFYQMHSFKFNFLNLGWENMFGTCQPMA